MWLAVTNEMFLDVMETETLNVLMSFGLAWYSSDALWENMTQLATDS